MENFLSLYQVIKNVEKVFDTNSAEYRDSVEGLLWSEATHFLRRGFSPEKVAEILADTCTSPKGDIVVSKQQIREAVANGYNRIKEEIFPLQQNEIIAGANLKNGIIPSTNDAHIQRLSRDIEAWGSTEGYGFGIYELDYSYGWLYPSEIMALVGAPGSMKTALALSAVDDFLACSSGKVLFFSLDMPAQTVAARRLMREMDCFQSDLYSRIKQKDPSVAEAQRSLNKGDAGRFRLIGKRRNGEPYEWREIADIALQVAPELIIIDYITLIGKYRSELEAVYDLMPKIKALADNLGIAVILLSQMGRGSKSAQKTGAGGHAAGGHYVEDAVDVEIELLKELDAEENPAVVATVSKTRKKQSGENFRLKFLPRSLSFAGTAEKVFRAKPNAKVFEL